MRDDYDSDLIGNNCSTVDAVSYKWWLHEPGA